MAAKGESGRGLIVTLVFFILLSIILGVTTYFGYDGQTQLADAKKKADADKKGMQDSRDWNRFQALVYKAYLGHKLTQKETEDLTLAYPGYKGGSLKGDDKEEVDKVLDKMDKAFGFDQEKKAPKKTFQEAIDELTARATKAEKDLEETVKAKDDALTKLQGQLKLLQADNRKLQEDLKAANDKTVAKGTDDQDQIKKGQEALAALGKEKEEEVKKLTDDLAKKVAELAQLTKKNTELEKNIERLQGQSKIASVSLLDHDRPKGKIVSIDRTGRMPVIDLGSADNIKPQLTFSVFGAGPGGQPIRHEVEGPDGKKVVDENGKPITVGKGTVEVVNVLSEHRAQVRVTGLRKPDADPLVPGDLLFNPAWSPNLKQHVAIAGIIDLTGEGAVDSPDAQMRILREFIRNLEAQNMVVDSYVDLKELKIQGEITRQTDYLIVGDLPNVAARDVNKEGNPRVERAGKVSTLVTDMQKKANQNAVNLITLRKFLAVTGYQLPRSKEALSSPGGPGYGASR